MIIEYAASRVRAQHAARVALHRRLYAASRLYFRRRDAAAADAEPASVGARVIAARFFPERRVSQVYAARDWKCQRYAAD